MENKNPLSPHIQIYRWHISSLVSITHRITGIINIIGITFICIWSCLLLLGENNYEAINLFLKSLFGKFIILGITWSFSFQILRRGWWTPLGLLWIIKDHPSTGVILVLGPSTSLVVDPGGLELTRCDCCILTIN